MSDLKVVVGICPEDNPADIREAYGSEAYNRLYPDCPDCGMKFAHDDDCSVWMQAQNAQLKQAVAELEAAWELDNKLRKSTDEESWDARQKLAGCLGVVVARAESLKSPAS